MIAGPLTPLGLVLSAGCLQQDVHRLNATDDTVSGLDRAPTFQKKAKYDLSD